MRPVLKALADQLGSPAKLLLAAGVDDPAHPIGTDAIAVMSAMEEADDGSGVLVLMDLGRRPPERRDRP